ncbi:MAG: PQQ-binding-like beta-propeller repeat protein [Pyrinomonadaceae bacterium]
MYFRGFLICSLVVVLAVGGDAFRAQGNGTGGAVLTSCSTRKVESPARGTLSSDGDRVYIGSNTGTLSSYSAKDLTVLWRSELGGEFGSDVLPTDAGAVVVTNSVPADGTGRDSVLRLIGKDSGVAAWSAKLPFSERYDLGTLGQGIAAVSKEGSVVLLDPGSSRIVRQSQQYGPVSAGPVFAGAKVIIGTSEKRVVVISAMDGSITSQFKVDFAPTSITATNAGALLIGDERGNVSLLSAKDNGVVWKFKSGAAVSSIREIEEGIIVTSLDNFVYLISDYNGDVIWKRRLSGRVVEGGPLVEGHIVVLVYGENLGYVLDLENGKVVGTVRSEEEDFINRSPVLVNGATFAVTTSNSLQTYAVGSCIPK